MSVASYVLGIVASALVLIVVIELLRHRRLRERHAIWWFVAGTLALIASVFPSTLEWASNLVGIELPTNLVFFMSIAILFLVCLQHSSELTQLESQVRVLAEQSAILDLRVRTLEGQREAASDTATETAVGDATNGNER